MKIRGSIGGASPASLLRPSVRWGLILAWVAWGVIAATELVIVFQEVRVVVFTGPIICFLSLAVIILASRGGFPALLGLGAAHVLVCLLFFGLVMALSWSPADAQRPFKLMGGFYAVGSLPVTWLLSRRAPRVLEKGRCASCGYLLTGLTEPRCPECGCPFDPAAAPG